MLYIAVARVYTASMVDREKRRSRVRAGGEAVRRKLKERPRLRPTVYGYLTEERESLRQGFAALFLSSTGELVAGIALASIAGILDDIPSRAVDADGAGFFGENELPDLSLSRVTPTQVRRFFEHHRRPDLPADFD